MNLIESELYRQDIMEAGCLALPWEKLQGKTVLISGANGMIGSFLIDLLMHRNREYGMNCRILALGRNEKKARERFKYDIDCEQFHFYCHDINFPLSMGDGKVDYVLHLASNTHPVAYSTDPIGTVLTNIVGTKNMLDFTAGHHAERFLFSSSNEIYGENRGDTEKFTESYCGYINCNALRAGYPESKRCGEALCQAYRKQMGLDIVIPRFTRTYGPTMLRNDTKAISQFVLRAVAGEDIVLKSDGTQYYSFTYVSDAVIGLLTILLEGENGEAYNVADDKGDIMLKDLAAIVAEASGQKVVFDLPDAVEAEGFSKVTKARLSGEKLKALGWSMRESIDTGIAKTIKILREINGFA